MRPREERINKLETNPDVSVLIIGAGINGIGTFRDLALQNIDVVMVDKGDYCSGASATSSHMVHGGIRYLENGEFRLVQEAVSERNRLIMNAPHLVKPLPTTIPIFKWASGLLNAPLKFVGLLDRPAERGAIVIKTGLVLYDSYTGKQRTVPGHEFRNRNQSLESFPGINPQVRFTATYYDGAMRSPERIAVELIKDALEANDRVTSLNYMKLVSAGGSTVSMQDEISGRTVQLNPSIVVNATGPWIDLVNASIGTETRYISGTKGSHVILDHPELYRVLGGHEFFFENSDGRIVLLFPLEGKVLMGTSDIRVDNPEDITINDEEIEYFFEMVGRVFPEIKLHRSQIIYTFSGVRPLQYTQRGVTGQISRDHVVQVDEPGEQCSFPVLSLVGGKWTSFRAFSEVAADKTLTRLGVERRVSTKDLPIGGGKSFPINEEETRKYIGHLHETSQVSNLTLERLLDLYGTQTGAMIEESQAAIHEPLATIPEFSHGEINYLLKEDVVHLDDLLLRRSSLGKIGMLSRQVVQEISEISAKALSWNKDRVEAEISRFEEILRRDHRVDYKGYIGADREFSS
jgi:glycerol-3-phosphate dehydrogenase